MSFGRANGATVDPESKRQNTASNNSRGINTGTGFRRIMERSRLTEEDLENFRLSIIQAHKKKHYKVLAITATLIVLSGIIILFLIS